MTLTNGYTIKEIGGSFVVVPTDQHIIDFSNQLQTNEAGAFILQAIEHGATYQQILDGLCVKYEATEGERSILEADLNEFLHYAKIHQLIEDDDLLTAIAI